VSREFAPGLKDPEPDVPQVPVPEILTVPFSAIEGVLEHKAWFGPALTVAIGTIVIEVVFVTTGQGVLFEEVKVNVTMPAVISAFVMLYVGVKEVLEGLNPPVPVVTQKPVVTPPVTLPLRLTLPTDEHTVCEGPATTTAIFFTNIFMVSFTARQFPFPVEVRTRVTVPVKISFGPGV
jgi:hypothetical protein